MIVNHNINLKDIFAFSNPLFIVLYICALYFFLSKDERYANYLLNVFLCVISVFAIIVTTIFIYKHLRVSADVEIGITWTNVSLNSIGNLISVVVSCRNERLLCQRSMATQQYNELNIDCI